MTAPRGARSRPPRAAWPLALLLLAMAVPLPSLAPPPALDPVRIEYTVNVQPGMADQGRLEVWWKASGFRDRVSAFCLQTDRHEYPVAEGSFGPLARNGGPWADHPTDHDPQAGKPACAEGYRAVVKDVDQIQASFQLDVRKPAFSPCGCEFNSYLGPDWGVIKAEALAIPFSYAFFAPQPTFRATVKFLLPPGWSAEAPWQRLGPDLYELAGDGAPLPRGFFALGRFTPELRDAGDAVGKEFVYVRLAGELRDKATLFEYLQKATPYYQSVYGNVTGRRILVVSAGAPMFTGGLGSTDSLFVHQNSSLETIAHEYAHVWQRFQTIDRAGESSIWVNEGDADLHGALSRFVTEIQPGFTLARLNQDFQETYDEYSDPRQRPEFQQPLAAATYGGPFEQVAYKKGMFTLLLLDREVQRITGDNATLNDVLRELNREYDAVVSQRQGEKRMSNHDVLGAVNRVVQRHANVDMLNFFRLYVWGNATEPCAPGCWPPRREVAAEVPVVFDRLEVSPELAEAGGTVTVRVLATNVRGAPEARSVELLIDDRVAARRNVTIGSLETLPVSFTVPAGAPGPHTARVAYLRQEYRVRTPAALEVASVRPAAPAQVGAAFDLLVEVRNGGESPADATVDVALGELQRSAEVRVPAGGTARARLPFLVVQEGEVAAEVLVRWAGGNVASSATVAVGPRDRDGDGVPDARDGYPDDPRLWEASPINDLRSKLGVPAPGALAALAVAGLAAALARPRRGRR